MSGAAEGGATDVAVVGGGLGGLAAAIRLAAAGRRVRLFEKNAAVGGKLARLVADGFAFDLGPSLLTLPDVFRGLFAAAGADFDADVEIARLDPICRYHFADGSVLELPDGLERQVEAVAAFNPSEADNYRRFARYARELYEVASEPFMYRPFGDFSGMGGPTGRAMLRQLPRLLSPRSLDGLARRYFRDERLVQLFGRFATYNGSSPYQAAATFALVPHVEHALGAYHVRGGMYRIAEAELALARRLGVSVETSSEVASIEVRDGRAVGVALADGERVAARAVVVNADAAVAYERLVARGTDERTRRRLLRAEPSSSALVSLVGLQRKMPTLAHHNIFFSADYPAEFRAIFRDRVAPSDPTVYVCAASRTDPTQAPDGCESLFLMINLPADARGEDWSALVLRLRAAVRERLARGGAEIDESAVAHESHLTPADFESRYGSRFGAIYGPSSNTRLQAFLRPPNRAPRVGGLFFAGGGSHPGGGMPLVTLSGAIAANLVGEYLRG